MQSATTPSGARRLTRVNQYAIARLATIGLGFTALACFVFGVLLAPRMEPRAGGNGDAGARLAQILQRIAHAPDERAQARIGAEAGARTPEMAAPLRAILETPGHRDLEAAIDCAGALGLAELRPQLAALAWSAAPSARGNAIRAAARLGAWPADELERFLQVDIAEVQVAALDVLPEDDDAPWETALALLASDRDEVRDAALRAVPRDPPLRAARVLAELVESDVPRRVVAGLRALCRTDLVGAYERTATDLLASSDREEQRAALELLTAKEAPLMEPEVVWALACDPATPTDVGARAIFCLERTRSYDVRAVLRGIDGLEPKLRYFAARCLVQSGVPQGGAVLIGLMGCDVPEAILASRKLLAQMTGAGVQASIVELQRRVSALPAMPRTLTPPDLEF
jgi:hypothetical protein